MEYNSKKAFLAILACGTALTNTAVAVEDNDASFVFYSQSDTVAAESPILVTTKPEEFAYCEKEPFKFASSSVKAKSDVKVVATAEKTEVQASSEVALEINNDTNTEETTSEDMFASNDSLNTETLDEERGTSGLGDSAGVAVLTAVSAHNEVNGEVNTGANTVGREAFNNSQGLISVIQNSGNNVTIQSSTVVNMTINQ